MRPQFTVVFQAVRPSLMASQTKHFQVASPPVRPPLTDLHISRFDFKMQAVRPPLTAWRSNPISVSLTPLMAEIDRSLA